MFPISEANRERWYYEEIAEYNAGEPLDLFLLIKQSTKGVTTQGKPFMTLILQDKSGDIEAKLWDTTDEHAKDICRSFDCQSWRGST